MTLKEFATKGGQARAAKLSDERRKEIASIAGRASAKQRTRHALISKLSFVVLPTPPFCQGRREGESDKEYARRLTQMALKQNRHLIPKDCPLCDNTGFKRMTAHHDDYTQPFRVAFICQNCHLIIHRGCRHVYP